MTLDISTAETVEDLFNLISGAQIGLAADRSTPKATASTSARCLSGADFTIGENGGTTATQLGIRTYNGSTPLADFNRGVGVPSNDLEVNSFDPNHCGRPRRSPPATARCLPSTWTVPLRSPTWSTRINNAAGNHVGTTSVTASLTPDGRGIQLVDSSTPYTP